MEKFWSGERFTAVLRRQHGRVTWAQLKALGVPDATISQWRTQGRLTRVLPRVYAIGPAIRGFEAQRWEAVLYAGPEAALSHRTAAQAWGLIKHSPAVVEVSTSRANVRSIPGAVCVHRGRDVVRTTCEGMPVTTIPQTLLDLAAVAPALLARALAVLDFRQQLDLGALEAVCGHGRRGSGALREALGQHQPALAQTNGELEERFLQWCQRWKVPMPKLNAHLHGIIVDAYWPGQRLVVELDGYANHSSPAQLRRDRERELTLRAYGLRVVRYDWALMHRRPAAMYADLMLQLARDS